MDIVIRNGISDRTGEPVEVGITGGRISAVQVSGLPSAPIEIDAEGGMISPAFIEPHFHLENALLWDGHINQSGTLHEAIELYAKVKHDLTIEDISERAGRILRAAVANGTLWLRSHVDIDHIAKLSILEGVVSVRDEFKDLIEVQLVAFPQLGLARNSAAVDMMWQAMEKGCDLVGGMPHGEKDMDDAARHIEIVFEIARVKQLLEAGVNVSCGQDDVQNMFYAYGKMDMLEVALITAHAAHLSAPGEIQAAFDMPRYNAAKLWRLEEYGLRVGTTANLVILDAKSAVEALRRQPDRRYVIGNGRILTETRTHVQWHH